MVVVVVVVVAVVVVGGGGCRSLPIPGAMCDPIIVGQRRLADPKPRSASFSVRLSVFVCDATHRSTSSVTAKEASVRCKASSSRMDRETR